MSGKLISILATLALLLFLASSSVAQTGSISGTVTDASGAVVSGAEVTVTNTETGAVRSGISGNSGTYNLSELAPGKYELVVKKESFKAFRVGDIELSVAQNARMDAKLEPGAVSEEVSVEGLAAPAIDLESAQVSNLVDHRQMVDLPLITRDPYSLILLSPGTSQTNTGLGGFTVNGSRERNNNFLLDGADNNDTSVPGIPDGALSANPDSTEEFRVITNNFNAEFGRNTGAIIDVITRSGTNQFHGDAYEFGRWSGFGAARDWFNPAGGSNPQNPYVRNQFGYSIGGPIIKNKTFFFFNEEFQRFRTATTGSATVPTAAFKTGMFTYIDPNTGTQTAVNLSDPSFQSGNYPPLTEDPTAQQIFSLYPNPTVQNGDGYTGTVFFPTGSKQNSYEAVAKIDHRFNDGESLSIRYAYDHSFDPDPFHDDVLPGGVGATSSKSISYGLSANLTSVLNPRVVNNFVFGWNHIYAAFTCGRHGVIDSTSPLDQFGNGRDYIMEPFVSFGCTPLGDSNGQNRKTGTVSYSEGISWVRGAHNLKFGIDFRTVGEGGPTNFGSRRQATLEPASLGGPNFYPLSTSAVPGATVQLQDAAAAYYGIVIQDSNSEYFNKAGTRVGSDNKQFRQHEYDGFAQDAWKVRTNFTLSLGLRYQFDGVPFEENSNFSNLLTNPAAFPVVFTTVGPGTGHQVYQNDWSNIEPRVGFSWDPWNDGKTAIRGAFGIFHDRVFGNLFGNARGNPPFEQDYSQFPVETINNAFGSGAFPAMVPNTMPSATIADGALISPVIIDPKFRNPVSDNWNFGIQREIGNDNAIDLSYVASKGTHIFREVDGNPPDPALVSQLVAFCSDPNNSFGCTPDTVTKGNLFEGTLFGSLPFNAVAHNALLQPFFIRSVGNSNYNSLQLKFTHRLNHGLQVQGAYTFAHAIDDSGDPLNPAAGNRGFPRNSRNLAEERGNSDNDIRHVAVFNYIWQLPVGRHRSYMSGGVVGKVLEGIEFSGISTIQTGHPFDVYSTTDMERTGLSGRADLVGNPFAPGTNPNASQGKVYFSNIAAFSGRADAFGGPLYVGPGSVGRNHFYGPGLVNTNLAFIKKTSITERVGMEFRFEGYNIFNHPQFTNPGNQIGSPLLGVITSTISQPDSTTSARQVQVGLRLSF